MRCSTRSRRALPAPLGGMGISFSSSLFGLAGSLVLGFLDLQASQAQNRFYTDLEDWLDHGAATSATSAPHGRRRRIRRASAARSSSLRDAVSDGGSNKAATTAMANLAEAIQGLVQHMRTEQQMIRDWVEAQAEQQRRHPRGCWKSWRAKRAQVGE